jgi:hypothetical protein
MKTDFETLKALSTYSINHLKQAEMNNIFILLHKAMAVHPFSASM